MPSLDYVATFWVQRLKGVKQTTLIEDAVAEQMEADTFLRTKHCYTDALEKLIDAPNVSNCQAQILLVGGP